MTRRTGTDATVEGVADGVGLGLGVGLGDGEVGNDGGCGTRGEGFAGPAGAHPTNTPTIAAEIINVCKGTLIRLSSRPEQPIETRQMVTAASPNGPANR